MKRLIYNVYKIFNKHTSTHKLYIRLVYGRPLLKIGIKRGSSAFLRLEAKTAGLSH